MNMIAFQRAVGVQILDPGPVLRHADYRCKGRIRVEIPQSHGHTVGAFLALQVKTGTSGSVSGQRFSGQPLHILGDLSATGIVPPDVSLPADDVGHEIQHKEPLTGCVFIAVAQGYIAANTQELQDYVADFRSRVDCPEESDDYVLKVCAGTLAIEQRSSEVWKLLGAVKSEFGKFATVLEKTHGQLNTVQNSIKQAGVRTRAIERQFRGVEALPGAEAQQLLGQNEEE